MIALLLLLFLAGQQSLTLIDDVVHVPPRSYETMFFRFTYESAVVTCFYDGPFQKAPQVGLVPAQQLNAQLEGTSHSWLSCGQGDPKRHRLSKGEYALVVLNQQGSSPVTVRVNVTLQLPPGQTQPQTLSRGKRLLVILAGFLSCLLLALLWWNLAQRAIAYSRQRSFLWPPWFE